MINVIKCEPRHVEISNTAEHDFLFDKRTRDFSHPQVFRKVRTKLSFLKDQKVKLESQKWELEWQMEARKVELADLETVTQYVNELRALLTESSIAERKSFIKSFVKEVVVTGDKAELKYTIPLSQEEPVEEGLEVLHIVRFSGPCGIRTKGLRCKSGLCSYSDLTGC